jgi:replicative DNA helicase
MASKLEGLSLFVVDFAEQMIPGESSESVMSAAFKIVTNTAKSLHIPAIVLSQLNRSYDGDIPRMTMLRYTGSAEALAALGLLLYNPEAILVKSGSEDILPTVNDCAWVIVGKSRFGTKKGQIGAALVEFDPLTGWGIKVIKWRPLSQSNMTTGIPPEKKNGRRR